MRASQGYRCIDHCSLLAIQLSTGLESVDDELKASDNAFCDADYHSCLRHGFVGKDVFLRLKFHEDLGPSSRFFETENCIATNDRRLWHCIEESFTTIGEATFLILNCQYSLNVMETQQYPSDQ